MDLDAERAQERLGERAGGDAGGGLARAGALEHVADVGEAVLLDAGEVGVAGPRQVDLLDLGLDRPGVHPLLPVRVVAVGDQQRDRAAERAPVADAGADLDRSRVSIFIRPPRPWPSWRRAMSRSSASRSSSSPAGRPSTIATSPGPCDSPAVVNLNPLIARKAICVRRLWS